MNEFEIIKKYFDVCTDSNNNSDVLLGIGDDCALLHIEPQYNMAVSTDTFLEGTHFFKGTEPKAIGYKSLAVNISDLAAMGATPVAFTLALTIPECNEDFLTKFAEGLFLLANKNHMQLIGGDTTRGPLSITITVFGKVEQGKEIRRSGAKDGDVVCVSGPLGGAAYAVALRYGNEKMPEDKNIIKKACSLLDYPNPRTDLIPWLHKFHASSALDISDGLLGDLNHILENSNCCACIDCDDIPVSSSLTLLSPEKQLNYAINGGDDYELCFTLSKKEFLKWKKESLYEKVPNIHKIGTIRNIINNDTNIKENNNNNAIITNNNSNLIKLSNDKVLNSNNFRCSFTHF